MAKQLPIMARVFAGIFLLAGVYYVYYIFIWLHWLKNVSLSGVQLNAAVWKLIFIVTTMVSNLGAGIGLLQIKKWAKRFCAWALVFDVLLFASGFVGGFYRGFGGGIATIIIVSVFVFTAAAFIIHRFNRYLIKVIDTNGT